MLGFLIGKLANRVRLPEITGYIVAGLLAGEAFLGVIPHEMDEGLGLVTEVALGLIAITIGAALLTSFLLLPTLLIQIEGKDGRLV